MEAQMDSTNEKLLRQIRQQMEAHPWHAPNWDCALSPSPAWRHGIRQYKQPAEIWEPFLSRLLMQSALNAREKIEYASKHCESPIEELFFLALVSAASAVHDGALPIIDGSEPAPFEFFNAAAVQPQYVVGRYRVDFKVSVYEVDLKDSSDLATADDGAPAEHLWKSGSILVEVDGHDFHERTKEQASHDKEKDRALQAAGFKVYRYTGSDIWHRCMDAAVEVVAAAKASAEKSEPLASRIETYHRF
jgi:very-short-patch-repair endonuclease